MIWLTVIIFIGMLLALVLVHEWGHFMAAKKAGCNVEEFGFGFPPKLFSKKWRGTVYSFNLLPIGGFVKIEGENMDEGNPGSGSFAVKSAGWRIFILSAGVIMNLVLAVVLLGWQSGVGAPVIVTEDNRGLVADQKTYVTSISSNSPASEAGLKQYDRIVEIDGVADPLISDVQAISQNRAGENVVFEIERQGIHETLEIAPRANPPAGEGAFGISLAATGLEKTPWYLTPWEGVKRTAQMTVAILVEFGRLIGKAFRGVNVQDTLTGPIGIAIYTNEAVSQGLSSFLELAALISINLAIVNILPFPALDGGRILFVLIEKIMGRRVPGKVESIVHTSGFALLILLMILITAKDVRHFFF